MDDPGQLLPFPQAPEGVELRHLRAFVAVAEELNFGRAAERLFVSQPALSRQIRALELLVDCELLRRSTHHVELTLAGEALLDKARPLLRDVDEAVSATQAVGGELMGRALRLFEQLSDVGPHDADLHEVRAAFEAMHANFELPPDVDVRPVNAGGVSALLVAPSSEISPTLLYLHGGGYILGSAFGYRPLAGALAKAANTAVLIPDFRLAPEHPFPAALEDAVRAYAWLVEQEHAPDALTLVGDSSGAGLVMSLLLTLKARGLPLPGGTMLFSPGVRIPMRSDDLLSEAAESEVVLEFAQRCADAYLAGHPADDPVVAPLSADLRGLPPMLIQAARGDAVRKDADALADRAQSHGVDVRLELFPTDVHCFQLFWSFLPEAIDAVEQAAAFARGVASSAGDAHPMPRSSARRRQRA